MGIHGSVVGTRVIYWMPAVSVDTPSILSAASWSFSVVGMLDPATTVMAIMACTHDLRRANRGGWI